MARVAVWTGNWRAVRPPIRIRGVAPHDGRLISGVQAVVHWPVSAPPIGSARQARGRVGAVGFACGIGRHLHELLTQNGVFPVRAKRRAPWDRARRRLGACLLRPCPYPFRQGGLISRVLRWHSRSR